MKRGQGFCKCKHRADSSACDNVHRGKHRLLRRSIRLMAAQAAAVTRCVAQVLAVIRGAVPSAIDKKPASHAKQDHGNVCEIKPDDHGKLTEEVIGPFDELAVVDYVEDIYKFHKCNETFDRPRHYIEDQVDISEEMRAGIVDLIIAVHDKFHLRPETLYLTVNLIDRYLSVKRVKGSELELIGVSALHVACKYEEIQSPEVDGIIYTTDGAYTRERVLETEVEILDSLKWRLCVPTQYMFLVRFLQTTMSDKDMEDMVFFLAELGLMQYSMVQYPPSVAAAAALYAARAILKKSPIWTETLELHTGLSEMQLLDCAQILVKCHLDAPRTNLRVACDKFSSNQ